MFAGLLKLCSQLSFCLSRVELWPSNGDHPHPEEVMVWETLSLIVALGKTKLVLMEMRWKVVELVARLVMDWWVSCVGWR